MCAKGRPLVRKPSAELDTVANALVAKMLDRLRAEVVARGQIGYLAIAAREFSEIEKMGPTRRIAFQLNRNSHIHMVSEARNDFGQWLNNVCQTIVPRQLLWLAENLCEVNGDLAWVEREIEKSRPDVQTEILSCAGSVSTGRPGDIASWLIDWPDDISADAALSALASGRLDIACTAKVRSAIGNCVEQPFLKAKQSATDHARILIAKENHAILRERPDIAPQQEKTNKLPAKKRDLAGYFDAANLTDKQREVISLRLEYGMSVSEIARRLGKNRKTVDELLTAARRRIERSGASEKAARQRAKLNPGNLN